jgi:hypothetical protein
MTKFSRQYQISVASCSKEIFKVLFLIVFLSKFNEGKVI